MISRANQTDDAFSRNLELGVACRDSDLAQRLLTYIDQLVASGLALATIPLPTKAGMDPYG
jgi:hypothetical protein